MMYKYGQYCPVGRAAEVLGDRWTLLIVRDLLVGVHHFSDLERGLPGIPRALLSDRLRRLQKVGVIERLEDPRTRRTGYYLTPAGLDLQPVMDALVNWGAKWAFGDPEPEELNPLLLMWWMRNRVVPERLPEQRVVVEFEFRDTTQNTFWLLLQPDDISICLHHPGFDIDVLVATELSTLYQVWLGRLEFNQAVRAGKIELDAVPAFIRAFPGWFAWSPLADGVRAVMKAAG